MSPHDAPRPAPHPNSPAAEPSAPATTPSATPVVLVHGLRISGAAMHRIAAALPDRRVLTPDLPGHGSRAAETFTMSDAVAAIADAIDDAGGRAIVAGISLGGYASMATAAAHPDKVSGLVLMGSTAQPSRLLAAPFRAFGAATSVLPAQAAVISRWLTRAALGRQVAADMEAGGLALHSIADVVEEVARFDALAAIARFPGPVLLANGGWDQFRIHEKTFAERSGHATLRVIPRATHLYPLIQPERTGQMIGEFAGEIDVTSSVDR